MRSHSRCGVRRYVQCNTAPAFESLAKSHPGWPVFITGHSMGGDRRCACFHILLLRALRMLEICPAQIGPRMHGIAMQPAAFKSLHIPLAFCVCLLWKDGCLLCRRCGDHTDPANEEGGSATRAGPHPLRRHWSRSCAESAARRDLQRVCHLRRPWVRYDLCLRQVNMACTSICFAWACPK